MAWNAIGNLIYLGCQWLVTISVTILGGYEPAGVLSLAMSMSATFQTVANFGIRNFQVSDVEKKYSDNCYVFFRMLCCLVALVGCMVTSLIVKYTFEQLLCVFLFMIFRLAESVSDVLHGIAQCRDRLDIAGKSFAMKGVGLLAIFLTVYATTKNLMLGLLSIAAYSCLTTVFYDVFATRRVATFSFFDTKTKWVSLAKETLPLCAYWFLNSAMMMVPRLILEDKRGEDLLGVYASIFAPALLIQMAMGYIYNPFAQILAQLRQKSDIKGFFKLSGKILGLILVLTVVMIFAASLVGEWGLALLFGDSIRPYVYLLNPILLAISATSTFGFLCLLSIVLRRFRFLLISCGVGFGCCLLLTGAMIDRFGLNGTSYSLILSIGVSSLILMIDLLVNLLKKEKQE